jgi:putative copper resistance protein D
MNALLAVARGAHFASAMLLFGELAFVLFVAPRGDDALRRLRPVALWSIAIAVASWLVWLVCEAVQMSGSPLAHGLDAHTLARVLGETSFGRLWLFRLGLLALLAALLISARVGRSGYRRGAIASLFLLAGVCLASLAWAGHAAAGSGVQGRIQLASDALHLLAAGAWLGALPGLVLLLGAKPGLAASAVAARRFSVLGIASVGTLLLTGIINARYLVQTLPRLFGTDYGRLLLAKIALVAVMLALAAVNRLVLTPRLASDGESAARLRRNARGEVAAGLGVIAIVAVLGITIPGAHQSPVWPFSRGLDLRPANPTSYARSPLRYTTAAIDRGAALYAWDCAVCHGPAGHGDGPAAASLRKRPANLAEHGASHRQGDLYWWIAHGIPDTPMPGFAASMSTEDIWSVVQFLHALSDAESAQTMTASASAMRPIVAPDFTFEIAGQAQETLAQARGHGMTLIVLYTLPRSLLRLQALQAQSREYERRGLRVVALPLQPQAGLAGSVDDRLRALAGADASIVYAMFARTADGARAAPEHVEFLVDREGSLRRRWMGAPADPTGRTAEVFDQIDALAHEPPLVAPPDEHEH